MTKKVKEVIEMLENYGWKFIGTKGSHRKFHKDGARRPIIVQGKESDDLPEGTFKSIIREAGIKL